MLAESGSRVVDGEEPAASADVDWIRRGVARRRTRGVGCPDQSTSNNNERDNEPYRSVVKFHNPWNVLAGSVPGGLSRQCGSFVQAGEIGGS